MLFQHFLAQWVKMSLNIRTAVPIIAPFNSPVGKHSVGIKSARLKSTSVGTQLSMGSLKAHVRSKAMQTQVSPVSADFGTTAHLQDSLLTSTPIKGPGWRPSKRPRLELEEEEESDSSNESHKDPLDSTYNPADSVLTEETDVSYETQPTPNEAKYIVFESCLKQLLENCPVCNCTSTPGATIASKTLWSLTNFRCEFFCSLCNEVGGSYHMEKEGLKRCLDHLEANGFKVDYIVTDRHPQIQKYLRERNITQFYDVWHFEKGLSKKLEKASHKEDILKKWLQSFKNHVYWLCLASMHHNENASREQATTSAGQAVYKVVYPKVKMGEGAVKPVKTDPTFNYVHDLMRLLMEVFEDPTSFDEEIKTIPIPPDLSAENKRTPKAELVARHVSRFNLEVV
ncbi:uncharacterized protein LOC115545772 [Gadus morhua]|uniref:uncharacterized protein LOC115545772 n=1 Tax=Gadus morhua TaxID=8049 RepID=UPI0011B725DC|nr:uncharacterized protein LOC115545772 [Gadus morhua]